MFCASCGKELTSGTRFCGECGTGISETPSTSAPAERGLAATNESVPLKKALSAWQGVLIGLGLLVFFVVLAAALGESAGTLIGLTVLGTSVWASIDSYQIRRRYTAKNTTAHPLGLFLLLILLWIIVLPSYLVNRSRVLAKFGAGQPSDPPTQKAASLSPAPDGAVFSKASKWVGPVVAVLIIADGVLNPNASATMKRKLNADASWADVVKSLFTFKSSADLQQLTAQAANMPTTSSGSAHLELYSGRVPDKAFWMRVDGIFIENLVGQGSQAGLAVESFVNNLNSYVFAPCQYDNQTGTMTVTWQGKSRKEEGDIAGSFSDNDAISFDINNPEAGIVANLSEDDGEDAHLSFYTHGRYSPVDANRIAGGDLSILPKDLRRWAETLIRRSDKPIKIAVN
jgi:hypothetical protein